MVATPEGITSSFTEGVFLQGGPSVLLQILHIFLVHLSLAAGGFQVSRRLLRVTLPGRVVQMLKIIHRTGSWVVCFLLLILAVVVCCLLEGLRRRY